MGNGAAGGTPVFSASGSPVTVTGGFPDSYGMSGVAYDPDDGTLWVANYVGAQSAAVPMYGVAECTENGAAAQTFDYATQFAPLNASENPYGITVCPKSATGGTTLIVVGFTGDTQSGIQVVQPFTTSGAPVGPPLTGSLGGLSAVSCDADGNVYIADAHGLFRNKVTSAGFAAGQYASLVSSGFSGLTPPIYGVYTEPSPASGSAPDGGVDATTSEGGGGGGDAGHAPCSGDGGIVSPSSDGGGPHVPTCTLPAAGADGGAVTIGTGCVLGPEVNASTTISASSCGVYDAPQGLNVTGATTVLTIDPGVTIAFGANTSLSVTGGAGLIVGAVGPSNGPSSGPPCAPVVFTSDSTAPTPGIWDQVYIQAPSAPGSSISNLIVQYAGSMSYSTSIGYSAFELDGRPTPYALGDFTVQLANVTLSHNGAQGFLFYGNHTGPAPGSGTLTVTDNPAGADPFNLFPDAAGLLNNVSLSVGAATQGTVHLAIPGVIGNTNTEIVDTTQTWPSVWPLVYVLGEPQNVFRSQADSPVLDVASGPAADAGLAVLTIAAPNTFLVETGFYMTVNGYFGYAIDTNNGAIVANGSCSAPISFGPLEDGGTWAGMYLAYPGSASSRMSYVAFHSAGNYGDYDSVSCGGHGPPGPSFNGATGSLVLGPLGNMCEPAPALSNLTFDFENIPADAGAWGILALTVGDPSSLDALNPGAVYPCSLQLCTP